MSRPIVWFTVCWVAGSAAAAELSMNGFALAGIAMTILLSALFGFNRREITLTLLCVLAFAAAGAHRMWEDADNVSALSLSQSNPELAIEATGMLVSAVEIDGDRVRFTLRTEEIVLQSEKQTRSMGGERLLVQVKLAQESELRTAGAWKRGQRVRISGVLSNPAGATNFGGFDYADYLKRQRIHWVASVQGASSVKPSEAKLDTAAAWLGIVDSMRSKMAAKMNELYPGEQGGYMQGLVLGIGDELDPDRFRQFSQLGLTHILAISGLHVAVYLYLMSIVLRLFRLTRERMQTALIAAVPLYVLLSGCSPSVVRAGLMAMLGLAAVRFGKLKDGLHLLAAAALLMLIYDPYLLYNVGFQLSFLVTAGLIVFVPPARRLLPSGGKIGWLYDAIIVTIVAQAASFPLSIYYFNQFNWLSLPANLVLVPFISFIVMPIGGASLLLASIWQPAGMLLAAAARAANAATFAGIDQLGEWTFGMMIWATPPIWWIGLYYLALYALLQGASKRKHNAGDNRNLWADVPEVEGNGEWPVSRPDSSRTSSIVVSHAGQAMDTIPLMPARQALEPVQDTGMSEPIVGRRVRWPTYAAAAVYGLLLWWAYNPHWNDRTAAVSFLDVGQGDAVLIRAASGKHVLVDGGGTVRFGREGESWRERRDPYEVGRKTVVPLLYKRGVRELDLLVISHLDSDHIGGLKAVANSVPIKAVLWNGTLKESDDAMSLMQELERLDIPLYRAALNSELTLDSASSIRIVGGAVEGTAHLAKTEDGIPMAEEQNGHSVAMVVRLHGRSFLLAGDADAEQEKRMIRDLTNGTPSSATDSDAAVGIDVMKASHHGSKTSTTPDWLAYWKPGSAVISAGRNNTYGHPHPSVLQRLADSNIPVLRTDLGGEAQWRALPDGTLSYRTRLTNGPAAID
ncbi:ComEC/Rec2 family competence protein [Paenibacillus methanolicus]|uniref:Competence protein ComEC n=1 Tax=Paenibacillus methanolicus TaxID=582686 RepID=A0A5S5CHS5_9BACL|nr:ComEC/Rec2 family competence protein [Paenibacillus methanolicus]TYP78052.1 competence protein ComEC [Paenibacillus methanolicus]